MPAKTGTSPLMAKLGATGRAVLMKHADDEVSLTQRGLPPGITNGIAKLTKCYFKQVEQGKQNAGEWYLRCEASAVEPKYHTYRGQEIKVADRPTSIIQMVSCDTKNSKGEVTSKEENLRKAQEILKSLGADPAEFKKPNHDLEQIAMAIVLAAPYIKFSTSPKKDQKTGEETGESWENWYGRADDDYTPPDDGDGPTDETGEAGETGGDEAGEGGGDESGGFDDGADLTTLLERVKKNSEDQDAIDKLKDLFHAAGYDEGDWEKASNWNQVRDAILNPKKEDGGGDESGADEEREIKKEEVYKYKVIDGKTGKPAVDPKTKKERKPIEVVVESVDKKTKKAVVKSLDDGKTKYTVKWDELTD